MVRMSLAWTRMFPRILLDGKGAGGGNTGKGRQVEQGGNIGRRHGQRCESTSMVGQVSVLISEEERMD